MTSPTTIKIYGDIQMICSGYPINDVLEAQLSCLCCLIAVATDSRDSAMHMIDVCSEDLKAGIMKNWTLYQEEKKRIAAHINPMPQGVV